MGGMEKQDKHCGRIIKMSRSSCLGGFPTVNLRLNKSRRNQQSTGIENKVGQSLLVPEELVWVDDLAALNPDGVVLNNLTVPQDFAVDDFGDFGLVLGEWSEGHGGRRRRSEVVVGLKGDRVLHHGERVLAGFFMIRRRVLPGR